MRLIVSSVGVDWADARELRATRMLHRLLNRNTAGCPPSVGYIFCRPWRGGPRYQPGWRIERWHRMWVSCDDAVDAVEW